MSDSNDNHNMHKKLVERHTVHIEPVIDRHYQLRETSKAIEIIQKAMDLAREEIPKGHVATYIPELGKVDPDRKSVV